jgi:hypothetical protein
MHRRHEIGQEAGMEVLRNILSFPWRSASATAPAEESREPEANTLHARTSEVIAATAGVYSAHNQRGTGFMLRHRGREFLVTSGHLTHNMNQHSTGFHYQGTLGHKVLFVVVRNGTVALAEHLAVNPQGHPCNANPKVMLENSNKQRDISILQLLNAQQTRQIIGELSGADARGKMQTVLTTALGTQTPIHDGWVDPDQLRSVTEPFRIETIPVPERIPTLRTPSAYMVGMARETTVAQVQTEASPFFSDVIPLRFRCEQPIVKGNSGALLYDVSTTGIVSPLGMVIGSNADKGENIASAVSIAQVREGINAVIEGRVVKGRTLPELCNVLQGLDGWYQVQASAPTASAHTASNAPLPPPTPKVAPAPKACPALAR